MARPVMVIRIKQGILSNIRENCKAMERELKSKFDNEYHILVLPDLTDCEYEGAFKIDAVWNVENVCEIKMAELSDRILAIMVANRLMN